MKNKLEYYIQVYFFNLYVGTPAGFDIRTFIESLRKIDLDNLKEFSKFIKKWLI